VGSGNLVEVYEWESRAVYVYYSGGFDVDFWEVGTGGGWLLREDLDRRR